MLWNSAVNCAQQSNRKHTRRPPGCAICFVKRKLWMNLDKLTQCSGEWLRGTGPESDIVISSRVRLARNLAAYPFTNRAGPAQKADLESLLRERIAKLERAPRLNYLSLANLSTLDRQFLVERQL